MPPPPPIYATYRNQKPQLHRKHVESILWLAFNDLAFVCSCLFDENDFVRFIQSKQPGHILAGMFLCVCVFMKFEPIAFVRIQSECVFFQLWPNNAGKYFICVDAFFKMADLFFFSGGEMLNSESCSEWSTKKRLFWNKKNEK